MAVSTNNELSRKEILTKLDALNERVQELEECLINHDQIELALLQSELKFRQIASNSSDMIHLNDIEGRIIYANPVTKQLLGYEPHEILNRSAIEFIHPDDRMRASFNMAANVEGENAPPIELRLKKKDGSYLDVEGTGFSVRLERAEPFIGAILRDISARKKEERERKHDRDRLEQLVADRTEDLITLNKSLKEQIERQEQTELSLRHSEKQHRKLLDEFHAVLDAFSDSLTLQDPHYEIIWANQSAARLMERELPDIIGKHCYELWRGKHTPCDDCPVQKAFQTGRKEHGETTTPDGRIFDLRAFPIPDETGKVTRVIEVGRDITNRKKIEDELLKAHKLESIGVLAGGIAHDFNNILMAIMGYINLASKSSSKEDLRSLLGSAENALKRAKDLTHQLLTFSKGGVPIKTASSIEDLIQQAAGFALSGSNVGCHIDAADDLWPADIDIGQISQVFQNLIINADNAMPQGGTINITCRNHQQQDDPDQALRPGRYVRIDVTDHGVGIPAEHLNRIFDPYFTTRELGQGLGLSTAYSIINRHRGKIFVDSAVGSGTTFHIFLPAAESATLPAKDREPDISPVGQARLLIMDDEEIVLEVLQKLLEESGYEVLTARNGDEAVAVYKQALTSDSPVDAVILDLTIPGGMGGAETLKCLQTEDPNVVAIASSGYSNNPIMSDYQQYGFQGVLPKPYTLQNLNQILNSVLSNAAS